MKAQEVVGPPQKTTHNEKFQATGQRSQSCRYSHVAPWGPKTILSSSLMKGSFLGFFWHLCSEFSCQGAQEGGGDLYL